jgi:hypothetical protein
MSNMQKLPPAALKELELTPSAAVDATPAATPAPPAAMHMK